VSKDEPTPSSQPDDAADAAAADADAAAAADAVDEDHRTDGLDLARAMMRGAVAPGSPAARKSRRPGAWARRARRGNEGGLSSAYPDDRDPQLLSGEVGRLIAQQGWGLDLQVRGVFARWTEVVGTEIGAHSLPETLTDGTLVVRTDSTAWATQLKLLAPTIVKRLNTELGSGTVTVVEVLGPNAPTWKHGRRGLRDGRGPRDTYG
jgi:predicted nucleic acid-binding Zn ribbon protein